MSRIKSVLATGAIVVGVVGGALALSAGPASADVACNRWGECWHVHDRLTYPGELGITWHEDAWHGRHMHWRRDRFEHGYYRNGVWIGF
jgi:hypothetical protein